MPRPFTFTEFMNKTATLKARGYARGADGGYSQTPTTEDSFLVSLQPRGGGKSEDSGSPTIESTSVAYTDEVGLTLNNGDYIIIDGDEFEIVNYEEIVAFVGSYTAIYLKQDKE